MTPGIAPQQLATFGSAPWWSQERISHRHSRMIVVKIRLMQENPTESPFGFPPPVHPLDVRIVRLLLESSLGDGPGRNTKTGKFNKRRVLQPRILQGRTNGNRI